MIVQRGERMGLDFQAELDALRGAGVDWEAELAAATNPSLQVGGGWLWVGGGREGCRVC